MKTELHFRVYNNPLMVSILSQMTSVTPSRPTSVRFILIICFNLHQGFPVHVFRLKLYMRFLSSSCVLHAPPISLSSYWSPTWNLMKIQIMNLIIMQYSPIARYFLCHRTEHCTQSLFSNALNLYLYLNMRHQVSLPLADHTGRAV
jgi:hypothetical protein